MVVQNIEIRREGMCTLNFKNTQEIYSIQKKFVYKRQRKLKRASLQGPIFLQEFSTSSSRVLRFSGKLSPIFFKGKW